MADKREIPSGWHEHPNGGGLVQNTASVADSCFVGKDAQVSGMRRSPGMRRSTGNAQVYGNAQVSGYAQVYGDAQVYGNAQVSGNALVSGNAQVYGMRRSTGMREVSGNARSTGRWVSECVGLFSSVHPRFAAFAYQLQKGSYPDWLPLQNFRVLG